MPTTLELVRVERRTCLHQALMQGTSDDTLHVIVIHVFFCGLWRI